MQPFNCINGIISVVKWFSFRISHLHCIMNLLMNVINKMLILLYYNLEFHRRLPAEDIVFLSCPRMRVSVRV